jgi:hypothetical protein
MNFNTLLERLKKHGIRISEVREFEDGRRIYLLVSKLPFPFSGKEEWYALKRKPGQNRVDVEEIEALLRHLWHAELDFFAKEADALGQLPGTVN